MCALLLPAQGTRHSYTGADSRVEGRDGKPGRRPTPPQLNFTRGTRAGDGAGLRASDRQASRPASSSVPSSANRRRRSWPRSRDRAAANVPPFHRSTTKPGQRSRECRSTRALCFEALDCFRRFGPTCTCTVCALSWQWVVVGSRSGQMVCGRESVWSCGEYGS